MAIEARMRAGATLIVPSSFMGSPKTMKQNFQDVMSIVRDFVHLSSMQSVYLFDDEERAAPRNNMLTAWFELKRMDPNANRYL
ncbi:hypothetical protein TNIN_269971 [Trichonephila inaurata madagascariensis]|uniref:Uncharacterized protein n=1 Tax=Trichonephila inaurata madagascariensis TaxID=2747483 RepID=A0A8X6IYF2_9ARAC|nr:hypothetical protein TNIN_269971 [Trichonephila inaurata madagascariensis]